jgi:predicted DNA-binding protein
MSILTVRLTEEEKRILEQRSRKAGVKKATFVRQLIRETPFETGRDVLADLEKRLGDKRLRIDK